MKFTGDDRYYVVLYVEDGNPKMQAFNAKHYKATDVAVRFYNAEKVKLFALTSKGFHEIH